MGMICPLHIAQPSGAKLNPKMRISATKGSAILVSDDEITGWYGGWAPSVLAGEDAVQRDDVADAKVRLHVVVRLVAADRLDHLRGERHARRRRDVGVDAALGA